MTEQPSPLVVDQRIRNRIIEYLELVSSFQAQRSYEAAASLADVPSEVINQWHDWVDRDPRQHDDHSPVYTPDEIDALVSSTPPGSPSPLASPNRCHRWPNANR